MEEDNSKNNIPAPKKRVRRTKDKLNDFKKKTEGMNYQQQLTFDGFANFISRLGVNNQQGQPGQNALSSGTYDFNLVTRNRILLEAAYRGNWIVGAAVNCVAEDMTRAGVDVTSGGDASEYKKIYSAISRLKINQSMSWGTSLGRLYGGALGVVQIKGQDLKSPLNLDTIAKDQFEGFVMYDRWQLNPYMVDVIDSGPDIGLPRYYQITTAPVASDVTSNPAAGLTTVHHSRCVRFIGIELPFFQAITEMMWGESILEQFWDRLISFDNSTMSAASLVDRANLRTVSIDGLREAVAEGGPAQQGILAQFEMMRYAQLNEGLTLLDSRDVFSQTSYTFSGLSDMMLQFGQQISGACGIPLVRLFGQSPAGLSATGESDMRMYYDRVNSLQESRLRNAYELVLKVLWRSVLGKPAPDDLEFQFKPLWQMNLNDKANNAKTVTEAILGAYNDGTISRTIALKELKQASANTGLFTNITEEYIDDAEDEDPPLPEMNPKAADPSVDPSTKPIQSLGSNAQSSDSKSGKKRWWQRK